MEDHKENEKHFDLPKRSTTNCLAPRRRWFIQISAVSSSGLIHIISSNEILTFALAINFRF